ncbi:GFA family protein [Hyphomonas atlantica corrig.]|uniref:GFA family protein n=1 Tax=Hyphomonas atlantica TaxID=1280948 RepID=UPI002352D0C5|nr:GFA family protein [Hyphomonas atlantica]
MEAQCACGQLVVILTVDVTPAVVACHCTACQRRSGSPFGVGAYYPRALLSFSGDSRAWTRQADSGGAFTTHFCPVCGSSVYWTTEKHPDAVGIAVGAIADPHFPAPVRSVWEETRHDWVVITSATQHFPKGRS